jgi:diamine N-acetyltransferase
MLELKGKHIYLRALEPNDLDFLYELENNTSIWEISGTTAPYSKHVLQKYLDNAHRDIYDVKQLRMCICDSEDRVIGLIDLFDFDPKNRRAGLGLVIREEADRNKGLGAEAISLMCKYAFAILNVHQIYANVAKDNEASIYLFTKLGFKEIGTKKDWIAYGNTFKDEILFQKINN